MDKTEQHYKAFQWLFFDTDHINYVKTDDTYFRIIKKIDKIVEDYCIPRKELLSDLFFKYLKTGGVDKHDASKGNIFTWIKQWLDLELNNYIRKLYSKERRIIAQMVRESDFENTDEVDLDTDFDIELFINPTTPEDLVSNAQQKLLLERHLSETEIGFLNGDLSPQEAVKLSGLSLNTFKKQLNTKLTKLQRILLDD